MVSPSLTVRAAKAGVWRLVGIGAGNVLRLGSNLVLTRLLVPEDFGLMAIVFTVHTGLVMSMDIGITSGIVRSDHGDQKRFLQTAWSIQIIQYVVIFLGLVFVAFFLHMSSGIVFDVLSVYSDPALPGLIVFSGISLLAQGFQTTNLALAERNVALGTVVVTELAAQVLSVALTLSIAFYHPSVWAIAIGAAVGSVAKTIIGHLSLPGPRMSLCWDRIYISEIWNFGKWLLLSSLFWFLANQGDRLVIGGLFDSKDFGVFAIAMIWIGVLKTVIQITSPISLSTLSEVQRDRPQDLARVMKKLRLAQDVMCICVAVFMICMGELLFSLLYPEPFASGGRFVVLFALSVVLMRYGPLGALLLTLGQSRQVSYMFLFSAVATFTVIPLAFYVLGASWAVLGASINIAFSIPILFYQISKVMRFHIFKEYMQLFIIVFIFTFYYFYSGYLI